MTGNQSEGTKKIVRDIGRMLTEETENQIETFCLIQ